MEEKKTILDVLNWHAQNKKAFRIQDAYKLIHQSVFGIGHLMDDSGKAKEYLEKELDSLMPMTTEGELIEQISPDGEIVRVNLRPFKYRGFDKDKLFEVMTLSAHKIRGDNEQFLKRWEMLKKAIEQNKTDFSIDEYSKFDLKVRESDYPVMHHSRSYNLLNKPAYRVVGRSILKEQFEELQAL
ncbi:hypothetical protein GF337_03950 [candidate division KSB1 bacterium]|nr:hypothetical protein [candidate division KSB1 bacterium]